MTPLSIPDLRRRAKKLPVHGPVGRSEILALCDLVAQLAAALKMCDDDDEKIGALSSYTSEQTKAALFAVREAGL